MTEKEEYVNGVLRTYDEFQPKDCRREAEREMSELAPFGVMFPNIKHIVSMYPKFDFIELKIEGDGIEYVIRFDPSLADREWVENTASMVYDKCLTLNGGKEEKSECTSKR